MHVTFLTSNSNCRTMLEVFTTNQMQLYCLMRSLSYFVFHKSYVLGNVWKLGFVNIKGSTNSLLFEKTKWPQRRRKPVLISQCQSRFTLPHRSFKTSMRNCHYPSLCTRRNCSCHQVQYVSFWAVTTENPIVDGTSCICPFSGCYSDYSLFSTKPHLWEEANKIFQRGTKRETSSLPFVLCPFQVLVAAQGHEIDQLS